MSNDYVLSDISLEGYQIVRTAYFEKYVEPVMTLFNTSIGFGMGCYTALGNCEFIQLMLNDSNHTILIKPINSKENEALSWRRSAQNVKYHKMDCAMFSRKLFERWGLNPKCHYRAIGSLVQCDKKIMLLFDFSDCRVYHGLKVLNEKK